MGARFEKGSPEQLFHALQKQHTKTADRLLAACGADHIGQPMILTILMQRENGTIESQKELASILRVSPATVAVSLKSMERDGYIRKLSNTEDQRCKPITITEKGRQAAKTVDHVFETLDHGMYCGFSPEELKLIASLYQRIIDNLERISLTENSNPEAR